jgi:hypothetical protein
MKEGMIGLVLLLAGCGSFMIDPQRAKLNQEILSIQRDYDVLSVTFTPDQRQKCARATAVQDQITLYEFYASLDEQQQAAVKSLLDRAYQVEQEWQRHPQTLQRDIAARHAARQRLAQDFSIPPSVP